MWAVVKHLLPQSALERVAFINTKESLAEVFELDKIPQGTCIAALYDPK